jgi:hypothetical protein
LSRWCMSAPPRCARSCFEWLDMLARNRSHGKQDLSSCV